MGVAGVLELLRREVGSCPDLSPSLPPALRKPLCLELLKSSP